MKIFALIAYFVVAFGFFSTAAVDTGDKLNSLFQGMMWPAHLGVFIYKETIKD